MTVEEIGLIVKQKRIEKFGSTYQFMLKNQMHNAKLYPVEDTPERITLAKLKRVTDILGLKIYINKQQIHNPLEIGEKISELRQMHQLTYKAMSDEIGLNPLTQKPLLCLSAIRHIETHSDKAKVINLIRILNIFNLQLIIK